MNNIILSFSEILREFDKIENKLFFDIIRMRID